jgi:NAD(P)-dependent dehydrogenase (short-subunit alcohol dehydrogenase family)
MRLNLLGPTVMTQAALPFMRRRKSSTIINVAPPAERGFDGSWQGSLATKFALIGFTETLRGEIGNAGLRLSLVLPDGGTNGPGANAIPPGWISAATVLAAKFRLADITAPPSPATVEALRSVAPRAAEALSGWVSAAQRLFRGTIEETDVSRQLPGDWLRLAVH